MEIILRKHRGSGSLCLKRTTILTLRSRRLAVLLPCSGQWLFFALVEPGRSHLFYNHRLAPTRCLVAVGDLLSLDGLDLVVEAMTTGPALLPSGGDHPSACDIEVVGEQSVPVTGNLWIGVGPPGGLCLGEWPGQHPRTLLLMFAQGRWHLHDLNNNPIARNGGLSPSSLVLENDDQIDIGAHHLRFHLRRPPAAIPPSSGTPEAPAQGKIDTRVDSQALQETAEIPRPAVLPIDSLSPKATALCQQLLPVLRGEKAALQGGPGAPRGVLGWLKLLRQPRSPEETLERLHFLLSCLPRDRVWLLELARFLDGQHYRDLCVRILTELCALYPQDGELVQTLAKCWYQQGRNPELPPLRRLEALKQAEKGTLQARKLSPDPLLTDLQEAVRRERTSLQALPAQVASSSDNEKIRPVRSMQ